MRVLYFHQHFTTPDGAGGTRSYEFAQALIARQHSVTIVCGRNDRGFLDLPWDSRNKYFRGKIDGINVIALPLDYSNRQGLARRSWVFLRYALRSVAIALSEPHDVLFATSTPLTAAIPGIVRKLLKPRGRFVFEVRDLWPELPKALGLKNPIILGGLSILEWLAYHSADACIGLAPGIVEGVRRRATARLRVEMIPNGCDLKLFRPGQRAELDLEGILPTDFVAAFIGAHGPANGLDAVLEAAAELKRRGRSDIKLVLIGDGREKDRLTKRAVTEQLDNCRFFPSIKKQELAQITGRMNCGLMILADVPAFYYGTSPNKFFDYLSAGLPILCNYPGWIADMINENECGCAVPSRDPVAFADALVWLADSPSAASAMGRRSRALAEQEFGRESLAEKFVEVLGDVA